MMEIKFNAGEDKSLAVEQLMEKKLGKLEKYFQKDVYVNVAYSANKREHIMKIDLTCGGKNYQAKTTSDDTYKNIDLCLDILKEKIKEDKYTMSDKYSKYEDNIEEDEE